MSSLRFISNRDWPMNSSLDRPKEVVLSALLEIIRKPFLKYGEKGRERKKSDNKEERRNCSW